MNQFADEAVITVSSGKGGNGCIAFRREKYIPNGGPNGGDGGRGGDVVFCVRRNLRTLAHLRYHPVLKAKNGGDGQGWNKFGKDGDDIVIAVPPGTTLRDNATGELVHDFASEDEDERFLFLKGGKGGWGNVHFKSSTNQAPRYAHKGKPGETRELKVELSVMADVGLVGFPNAGKSSLLDFFTNARPKIAPYPFTTKVPNLGVLHVDDEADLIIADIPGIIEGASEGAGLGMKFLKHISRTVGLLFMIDASEPGAEDAYETLCRELDSFGADLARKKRIVLCNKLDVEGAEERALSIERRVGELTPGVPVIPVSVMARRNMDKARSAIITLVQESGALRLPGSHHADGSHGDGTGERSGFLATRSVDDSREEQYPGGEGA